MKRELYDADHEAFRSSVRSFLGTAWHPFLSWALAV